MQNDKTTSVEDELQRLAKDDYSISAKKIEPSGITLQDMESSMNQFLNYLIRPVDSFKAEKAFIILNRYLQDYQRLLYSTITLFVYAKVEIDLKERGQSVSTVHNLMNNLQNLIDYLDNSDNIKDLQSTHKIDQQSIDDTKKTVWKVWDHVNLAQRQYDDLKQTDEEYNQKFEERIAKFQNKLTSDISAQLLSLVSIFTALAFILFGGIGSLQNVFSNLHETDLLKLMILACVWSLGMLNILFIFLFCIAKMTKLPLSISPYEDGTFWQRYGVFWWSDFVLLVLMLVLIWIYFCKQAVGGAWLSELMLADPKTTSIIGTVLLLCLIVRTGLSLYNITQTTNMKDIEESADVVTTEHVGESEELIDTGIITEAEAMTEIKKNENIMENGELEDTKDELDVKNITAMKEVDKLEEGDG